MAKSHPHIESKTMSIDEIIQEGYIDYIRALEFLGMAILKQTQKCPNGNDEWTEKEQWIVVLQKLKDCFKKERMVNSLHAAKTL